jgi:D-alanyl-D-alanine carboxypeptidase
MHHRPAAHGKRRSRQAIRGSLIATALLSLLALPLSARADPSESPEPTSSAPAESATADPGPEASPTAADSSTPATPTATPTPAGPPTSSSASQAGTAIKTAATPSITLTVGAAQTPVAGHLFEDIGRFAISGSVDADDATASIAVYRRPTGGSTWTKMTQIPSDTAGRFSTSVPVTDAGTFTFVATIGGSPTSSGAVVSKPVGVTVEKAYVVMDKIPTSVDSLKDLTVTGRVVPARPGVTITIEVKKSGTYVATGATASTTSSGRFSAKLSYGRGALASYRIRARYAPANRPSKEKASASQVVQRVAALNALVTGTTAAEVAKTYRAGCPIGRSKLSTITMNFYGYDQRMHRGVIIVRKDLTSRVIRAFSSALTHRYPVARMNNPNVYGGNDPVQMAANNTSGFNCRKVVGNPYRMSPHSYGIAIDVNTVQNPYRDARGTWWPSEGRAYIKRTPVRKGMLTSSSYLTTSLRKDAFFWGGYWNPGRDYQHFEFRG